MKVYVVLENIDLGDRICGIYANEELANEVRQNLCDRRCDSNENYANLLYAFGRTDFSVEEFTVESD